MGKHKSCFKTAAGNMAGGSEPWPRIGFPWAADFWTYPYCARPALLWLQARFAAPHWRCERCQEHGRLDLRDNGVQR
jgi:hypothetical protein